MQLKIQRSQRMGGVMGGTVVFCIDAQAEYSRPEQDNIARYKLGKQIIYNSRAAQKHIERAKLGAQIGGAWGYAGSAASFVLAKMSLNISVDSLGWGQHIECKDMLELLEAEEEVMVACRMLKRFLETAATFNGSLALIDFDNDEKLHTGQGSLELIADMTSGPAECPPLRQVEADEYASWHDWFDNLDSDKLAKIAWIAVPAALILFTLWWLAHGGH